ncbi:3,4-dihydroxy-2-butanone-4-phosphate synthase [Pseudooceanicola spongiae]|jgi:3,4-dihydroxy-2-butanone 4-phosphate synthase|uniref:3,4-dihydroxy-2-butanone 4-phosphate synthase n=1 Tax=Pseudooceanicola spongiae TaxID=2613965 RepID=A0A7L9WI35_9RHOB|nr:3,4-dihydroxy-2-butanone-4-phosphate synthase [Pseudooceanicola spongiae]QOL79899.1 3,4-dihydroxy-2-butanone 4-phosphate synthase [Pseudooceanicola spongiae]
MILQDMDFDGNTALSEEVTQACEALAEGRIVVLSGTRAGPVLAMAAEAVTPERVNFMAREARGLVGMALTPRKAAMLGLSLQPRRGGGERPLFTVSIEAREGIETGISSADRALTILTATHCDTGERIVTPGHIFPQISEGDAGAQADCALALLKAAGLSPVAALCSMIGAGGEALSDADAEAFARAQGLVCVDARAIAPLV